MLSTISLNDIKNYKIHGRTGTTRNPLALFWTGSGIEFNCKSSELWIEVEADYEVYEPWISILVNDAWVSRQMITKGRQWVCVFRNMDGQKSKNIKIMKDVQAMSGDNSHCLLIHGVRTDGSFLPVEDKALKLEFIGDSITSGEGTIGAKSEEEWISMWFSSQNNYTAMTAMDLLAEYRIISQSGFGVHSSWDNNPAGALPLYYKEICGLALGEKNALLGAQDVNDFFAWIPNIIVINLGTNDAGAFSSPEWRDEKTGKVFQQRCHEDGSYYQEDTDRFIESTVNFLNLVRACNPESYILWAYGILGTPMLSYIKEGISTYQKNTQDTRVSLLVLPEMTPEGTGARTHPGTGAHRAAADVLVTEIKKIIKSEEMQIK